MAERGAFENRRRHQQPTARLQLATVLKKTRPEWEGRWLLRANLRDRDMPDTATAFAGSIEGAAIAGVDHNSYRAVG